MEKDPKHLLEEVGKLGITLTDTQVSQLLQYYDLLVEWNSFMNLTGITEYEEVVIKHFVDSLSLVKGFDLSKEYYLIDVGTGAGFPGLPLKIVFPNLKVTLLDSLNKRINFLNEVISALDLTDIETIHGRAEDFAKKKEYRESFDFCVSRAVANLSVLSEYCLPFVKLDGYFVSYKSEKLAEELSASAKAISVLGGSVEKQVDFYLQDSMYRNLVCIKKVNSTPKAYPRKAGTAVKSPIC